MPWLEVDQNEIRLMALANEGEAPEVMLARTARRERDETRAVVAALTQWHREELVAPDRWFTTGQKVTQGYTVWPQERNVDVVINPAARVDMKHELAKPREAGLRASVQRRLEDRRTQRSIDHTRRETRENVQRWQQEAAARGAYRL
jgi:hypothetical protein